ARAPRALVQQAHQDLVHAVDVAPEIVQGRHGCPLGEALRYGVTAAPLSHRTYDAIRSTSSGESRFSAIRETSALPTTAASAKVATSATCSGREMPNPSAIGRVVCARIRRASASALAATRSRAPVTPSREIPYRNPRP